MHAAHLNPQGCLANGCDQGYECDEFTATCKPQASLLGRSAAAASVEMAVIDGSAPGRKRCPLV